MKQVTSSRPMRRLPIDAFRPFQRPPKKKAAPTTQANCNGVTPSSRRSGWHPASGAAAALLLLLFLYAAARRAAVARTSSALDDILLSDAFAHGRYVHAWTEGNLLVLDNRAVMHRSLGGYANERRLLRRTQAWVAKKK